MIQTKAMKERAIEAHLRFYKTYLCGIKNCEQQLNYIMPTLVSRYEVCTDSGESFFIVNNTEKVALDRIESRMALNLKEEIERFKLVCSSIENAVEELTLQERAFVHLRYFECKPITAVTSALGYAEAKSVYLIRRHVLDKLLISLNNLLSLN